MTPEKINAMIEGVATGLVGALALGVFSISKNSIKSWFLRRQILRRVRNMGAGYGVNDITLTISNYMGVVLRVREVKLVTNGDRNVRCEMQFCGEVKSCRKISRKEQKKMIQRVKKGEDVLVESVLSSPKPTAEPVSLDESGWVLLRPFMAATFRVPIQVLIKYNMVPVSAIVLVEYTNCSNVVELLEVEANNNTGDSLKRYHEKNLEELQSGRLNEVRKQFGLPPIEVPSAKETAGSAKQAVN
ncbi:hypothetical protein [Brevifollis gellanilyticus]|uniref:Uncharacterized protein n=1 Tax=Brevifollis gellanilyticus TaxID=748831 RepID=A0A512MG95_9BACT|nr:hypothetical protein [Brevifollis gellanilyticus]GEP45371.1 hypothetical protein BGE01nite_46620 [Brevifollis gellanilyticus]